ncbi:MAG: UDP-N-acetylglucosamine 2-epimerase (non-hydrolyzing) [Bryobacterales bacterium]|nr:UDP-N-acetylglucosamine 2-epimerase (non-hydrolyzing) [Bryobacterales bacterium]
MSRKKILHVVGARPNFMKIAPLMAAMAGRSGDFEQFLVHTGQHYDEAMSDVFFRELGLPRPDVNLDVGSGSHAQQTAQVMLRFEPALLEFRPDWVIVPGDVNSTIACALVAAKMEIRVAHLEAGLRSFDRTMPEEINRVLTDHISDALLTPSADGDENLRREGVDGSKIHLVGNIMIDSLVRLLPHAMEREGEARRAVGLGEREPFLLATMHRPSNVDRPENLIEILSALNEIARELPVVMPVHPRTRQRIGEMKFTPAEKLLLAAPLGYLDFLALESKAALVLTDSGGVQEETTFLGIACLTARPNTERPVTISMGTNELVASGCGAIVEAARRKLGRRVESRRPPLWDGRTGERIAELFAGWAR